MLAGTLDRRITIQAKTVTTNPDYGTQTVVWTDFAARIPAQVVDSLPSRAENDQQGIKIAVQPARVRIRYMSGITSDMRVVLHGVTDRVMQITAGPAEIGRRQFVELMCETFSTTGAAA